MKPQRGVLSKFRPQGVVSVPREIEEIVKLVRSRHPRSDAKDMVRAYQLAEMVHRGQQRKSGEEFIAHPIGVAQILAELGMDSTTIVAALLHDSVEDTSLELKEIEESFGSEVALIIDGLTKIEKIRFRSAEQEKAENLRKMIVAMAKDLRVLIIKLADRLHNMRTIEPLAADKRALLATETLELYAPLAHRLGMEQIKSELEDRAFRELHPKVYAEVEQMVQQRQPQREEYLEKVIEQISEQLREVKVKAEIKGRPKHYYSIYEKMIGRGRAFDEIFDLVGVRVLVDSVKDCYAAIGAIHSLWRPFPGRFKDYIAMPKFNLYRSLHTTVVGPEGKPLEIQIRTHEMHRIAERGIAAHWQYKQAPRGGGSGASGEQATWMKRMVELQHTEDDAEFLASLRLDLFADEVFIFTPKGDVVELPKGSTPIDFAYSIHTEVGHSCVGARMNGKLVPLTHQLSSGETVEVITSKASAGPSRDWLEAVATPRARTKIKQWFTSQRREEAVTEGKESVYRAFRKAKLPIQKLVADGTLESLARDLKFSSLEALFVSVGEGHMAASTVVKRYVREHAIPPEEESPILPPAKIRTKAPATQGIIVQGTDEVLVKLAKCCMPVPGDSIMGFVTKGRGISVHRVDCPNAEDLLTQQDRLTAVSWDPNASGTYPVSIQLEALDRPKLLRDVTTAISDYGLNINQASSQVGGGFAKLQFTFEITNPAQLTAVINTVKKVESVYDAYRITPR